MKRRLQKSSWQTPTFAVNLTFFVYFVPPVLILLSGGRLLEKFNPVQLRYPAYSIAIFIINWVLLNVLLLAARSLKLKRVPTLHSNQLRLVLIAFYALAGLSSLIYLNVQLGILGMLFTLMHGEFLAFGIEFAAVGVALATEHLLKFYLLSNLVVIAAFLLRPQLKQKGILFWNVGMLLLVLDYLLISRREIVLLIGLLFLFDRWSRFRERFHRGTLVAVFLVLISFVGIVNLRTGNSFLSLASFVDSQEFSPFQVGIYLVDRGIASFHLGNPLDLVLPLENYRTLAARELENHFYYREIAGPTVSINPILFTYGYLPVCLYCFLFFCLCKSVYAAYLSQSDPIFTVLYAFLYVKVFILIRNGEIFIHYLDLFIFLFFCLPFFVVTGTASSIPMKEAHS